jgi:hypothetical protein
LTPLLRHGLFSRSLAGGNEAASPRGLVVEASKMFFNGSRIPKHATTDFEALRKEALLFPVDERGVRLTNAAYA